MRASLDELMDIDCAEDLFERLDVPFDPAVLAPARLQVLRAFGAWIAQMDAPATPRPPDEERTRHYRDALSRAYRLLALAGAREQRGNAARCGSCVVADGCDDG
jgi:hypothetical protein